MGDHLVRCDRCSAIVAGGKEFGDHMDYHHQKDKEAIDQRKNKEAIDAIERLKKFILDDGAKRMPDATSGHPCDMIILYVLGLEENLAIRKNRKMLEDTELSELMELVAGRGKYAFFGAGINTYPAGDDNNRKIHSYCLDLERHRLIHRQTETETQVLWMPGQDGSV